MEWNAGRPLQLLLLLCLACSSSAQGVQPGAERGSDGAAGLVPAVAAHVIEVNDSLGLYEALLVAEQENVTVLLLNDVDMDDPAWEGADITFPHGRTVLFTADLNPDPPNISSSVDALPQAGAKALNFSRRAGVVHMESNSTLAFHGVILTDAALPEAEARLNITYRTGVAVYPSVLSTPGCTVVYSSTWINYWSADCDVSSFNGLVFRLGIAVKNASAVGLLDPTTVYILGTTPLQFPVTMGPDNSQVGETTVVVDNAVLHCRIAPRPGTQPAAGGGGGGGGGIPAWGWVLIGLGIAAVLSGALLAGLLFRRRKRSAAAAKDHGGRIAAALIHQESDQPFKEGLVSEIDMASLQRLRVAWRERIGEMHDLAFEEVVGRGGYATVYRGRWKGAPVAIKLIEHSLTSALAQQVKREAALSTAVSHPNVVSTYKVATVAIQELGRLQPILEVVGPSLPTPEGSRQLTPLSSIGSASAPAPDSAARAGGDGSASGSGGGGSGSGAAPAPTVADGGAAAPAGPAPPASGDSELCATLILQEYCDRGSVEGAMAQRALFWGPDGAAPDAVAIVRLLLDVATAGDYLHSVASLLHLDLKSANILLKSVGYTRRGYVGKLADFGLSRALEGQQTLVRTAAVGTAAFMAPEVIAEGRLTRAADVYAFAVLMWELWAGEAAFRGVPTPQLSYMVVHERRRLPLPAGIDPAYAALMSRCWAHDPAARPSFEEILTELRALLTALLRAGHPDDGGRGQAASPAPPAMT